MHAFPRLFSLLGFRCLAVVVGVSLGAACSQPSNYQPGVFAWDGSGGWGMDTSGQDLGGRGGPDAIESDSVESDGAESDSLQGDGIDNDGAQNDGAQNDGGQGTDVDPDAQAPDVVDPDGGAPGSDAEATPDATSQDAVDADEPEDGQVPDTTVQDAKADVKDAQDVYDGPDVPWWAQPLPDGAGVTQDVPPPPDGYVAPGVCAPVLGKLSVLETKGGGGKLDIVIWIDTSGSMSQEAAWVNQNVIKFMNYLAGKGLDYRVVMFGQGLGLCSSGCPVNDPQHFLWVQQYVGSTNGPNLISTATNFNKYKLFLRPDATHNIVAITDDNCYMQSAQFINIYKGLLKGQGLNENFVYHSIVSFVNANNPSQSGNCPGGASYGSFHIQTSQATGGSMFQLCQKDWTVLFDELAKSVAATAKAVCTYDVLPIAKGKKYNPSEVQVTHVESQTDGTTKVKALKHIASEPDCKTATDGWFFDNNTSPTQVTICESKCKDLVGGNLLFNFGCAM